MVIVHAAVVRDVIKVCLCLGLQRRRFSLRVWRVSRELSSPRLNCRTHSATAVPCRADRKYSHRELSLCGAALPTLFVS